MHAICTNLACHWGPDVRRSSQVLKLDQVKRLRQIFCWTNNTQEFSSEKSGDTIVPYQFAISYLVVLSQEVPKSQPCRKDLYFFLRKAGRVGVVYRVNGVAFWNYGCCIVCVNFVLRTAWT